MKANKKTKIICRSVFGNQNFKELYIAYIKSKLNT